MNVRSSLSTVLHIENTAFVSMSSSAVAVSAPGKVLFAGGFLVLDRAHTGLVFGLDARIHVLIEPDRGREGRGVQAGNGASGLVEVRSPQFLEAEWVYEVDAGRAGGESVGVRQIEGRRRDAESASGSLKPNKFVETTLRYVLTYLAHVLGNGATETLSQSVKVTILADDDYYSQSQPTASSSSARGKSGFTNFGVRLSDAHKTGLGSSAALVTALVSALLAFYGRRSKEDASFHHATVHNLAQAAHCAAQGKVGSGFDVAAAVYGSCLYRRFTPSILESVGEPTSAGFAERLHRCVDDLELERKWDVDVQSQAVKIPESLLLVMCDVDCGSETPGMVRKVLQWRKENAEEARLLWNAIQQGTEETCRELRRLVEQEGIVDGDDRFTALADNILTIRSLVREMSSKSGVPIEPPVIRELLDFCSAGPGVVGGVAPGAGGYDAVALLVRNDGKTMGELAQRLEGWKSKEAGTGATIGRVRLLGVKQEQEGVKMEDAKRYDGWS